MTDAINYTYDIDIYELWANMVVNNQVEGPFVGKYFTGFTSHKTTSPTPMGTKRSCSDITVKLSITSALRMYKASQEEIMRINFAQRTLMK